MRAACKNEGARLAQFIWDPAVRWPPPANILLNYDVVPPDVPTVTEEIVLHAFNPIYREEKDPMTKVIIVGEVYNAGLEVGGGPIMPGAPGGPVDPGWGGGWSGRPDYIWGQRPPHVGGGPVYPGHPSGQPLPPGGPVDPGWGSGWGGVDRPPYIWGQRPSIGGGPVYPPGHPSAGLPIQPGHPGNWVPGSGYPTGGPILPEPPAGGTDVPADVYTPAPPQEDISSQYIVSVYDPKTMTWTTKSYPPPAA